jgi:hypothetical protein
VGRELLLAAPHGDPARAHRGQVGATGDENDILAGARQARTKQTTDRARADDRDSHLMNASATERR